MAAYAALVSVKRKISKILNFVDVLLHPLARETYELASKELKSFQIFLEVLDSRSRKRMNSSLERAAEAIRKFDQCLLYHKMGDNILIECEEESDLDVYLDDVRYIAGEARSLIETLKKVKEEYSLLEDGGGVSSSSSSITVSKSKVFGLCDQPRRLKEDVLDPWIDNTFYAVVGMAGIGKTNLVREILIDIDISEWFECRAAVTLGNCKLSPEQITRAILAQVDPETYKRIVGGYDQEEVGEVLKATLKGKRYLIVLDDVWSENTIHDYVDTSFPNNRNGSRVLLTTRMKYIVQARSFSCYLFDMRLLDKKESWDLLCEKVFAGGSCPPHLVKAGEEIAEKCDGLPLTIVTVGDLLSKAEEPPESLWIDVAENKKHQIFIDAYDQISQVLYPSYTKLNDELLKSCFLYMGAFPQKFVIPKTRLINLWLTEELIEPYMNLTLEACAINTLQYFDLNCLIMVNQRAASCLFPMRFGANVKTCRLHSSWWEFCQREARKTNFFYALDCYEDGLEEGIIGQTRLTVHNNILFAIKDVNNSIEENCENTARSLLCLGPYNPYMVPICFGLKLLQRLDALNIRFYSFPWEVLELVELKYLSLTCNEKILPSSISKLEKLQYLIVKPDLSIKSRGALFYLPMEIWDMKELQHLQVMGIDLPDLGETSLQKLSTLSNMTTNGFIVLKRVHNLKKLGVRVELAPDVAQPLFRFDYISHLTKLESLKCVIVNPEYNFEVVPPIISFSCLPFYLKKLSFNGLGYPWEKMNNIASLPNLQVLKLQCNSFQGPKWKVEGNEFPMIKSLLMEDIDLVNLEWAHGSFKSLESIRIKHCYKLKQLNLGDLQQVWEIEVVDSNPLVEWSVKYNALTKVDVKRLSIHSSWKS